MRRLVFLALTALFLVPDEQISCIPRRPYSPTQTCVWAADHRRARAHAASIRIRCYSFSTPTDLPTAQFPVEYHGRSIAMALSLISRPSPLSPIRTIAGRKNQSAQPSSGSFSCNRAPPRPRALSACVVFRRTVFGASAPRMLCTHFRCFFSVLSSLCGPPCSPCPSSCYLSFVA